MPISLIITDFKMPILNGVSMIKELKAYIRKQNRTSESLKVCNPRFMVSSAYLSDSIKALLKKDGIKDCYEKPLSADQINNVIK